NVTGLVPKGGLEPPRVAPHAPQTCASASSATSAPAESKYAAESRGLSIRATPLSTVGRFDVPPPASASPFTDRGQPPPRAPAGAGDRAHLEFLRRAGCTRAP